MGAFLTRRRLAWTALAVLGVLAVAVTLWAAFAPDEIVLTTAQLQERINGALPREFKGVTVERATIAIADGRVSFRVEAHATALGQTVKAAVAARGIPRYDHERGEVFFDAEDVKVSDFAVSGGALAQRVERLGGPLRERAEAVAGDAIAAGIKAYLASLPVYRIKSDLKGLVIRAAVTDITMRPEAIAISLALVKVTAIVVVGLAFVLLLLFLAIQLVRHPRWGVNVLNTSLDIVTGA
jgi:hypothetical protein